MESNQTLKINSSRSSNSLYFFGARHTNDPADQQFISLKESWKEFLEKTGKGKIAFTEGATGEIPRDYEEAIREYGETGALHWLGREAGVEVRRPEPRDDDTRRDLIASFDVSLVAYTIIAQNLSSWFHRTSEISFNTALERVLKREEKFSDIYGFTPNLE